MRKHWLYYLSLVFFLILGLVFVLQAKQNTALQITIVAFLAGSYVVLGLLHHILDHSISLKIVLEYLGVAMLGMAIVFFVFKLGL